MSHLVGELGLAIAALFGGAEFVFEEGVVLGAYNGKVIAHDSDIYCDFAVVQRTLFEAAFRRSGD